MFGFESGATQKKVYILDIEARTARSCHLMGSRADRIWLSTSIHPTFTGSNWPPRIHRCVNMITQCIRLAPGELCSGGCANVDRPCLMPFRGSIFNPSILATTDTLMYPLDCIGAIATDLCPERRTTVG